MLSKREDAIMKIIYEQGVNKKSFLLSPMDIKTLTHFEMSEKEIDKIIVDLSRDGYFDYIYSDRHGESVYCITLTERGKGYDRAQLLQKRSLWYRLILTVGFAIISFIIGLILKSVF